MWGVFFLLFNLNGYLDAAKMSKIQHHSHEKVFSSGNHLLKHFNQLVWIWLSLENDREICAPICTTKPGNIPLQEFLFIIIALPYPEQSAWAWSLPWGGPWDGSRSLKGEMQPHAPVCLVALHCSGLLISDHDSHTAWGAVQFYLTQRWTAFHTNWSTAELRFLAGVCQGCLKGTGTLAMGFSIQWYSAKSTEDFAWQEQGVTPRPWLFSM